MKISLLVVVTIFMVACVEKTDNNLSTTEALEKYIPLFENKSFLVFPELREKPIKWFDSIPERKIKETLNPSDFVMTAQPGEFFVFQLGVWALKNDVDDLQIEFSDLKGTKGKRIAAARISCFNKGGIDFRGEPFSKKINIQSGRIQSLWMGIDLDGIEKNTFTGSVSVVAGNEKQIVPLRLKVSGEGVINHGFNEGNRLSRLNWLNSTVGIDGVYIDDSALDRFTLRRARKIIDRSRPEGRIDFHSWNHFHKYA